MGGAIACGVRKIKDLSLLLIRLFALVSLVLIVVVLFLHHIQVFTFIFNNQHNIVTVMMICQFRKNLYSLVDKITNEVDMNSERFLLFSPLPIHTMRFEGDDGNNFDGIVL